MPHDPTRLEQGLIAIGDLLKDRGHDYEIVLIGAGAMMLEHLAPRPTEDLDVVAFRTEGRLTESKPFPEPLQRAVVDVGKALGLPLRETHGKDWLNAGPSILVRMGLPEGFEERMTQRTYGSLVVHVAHRTDIIHLKLLAATDIRRPNTRKNADIEDLARIEPTRLEIMGAARWVAMKDGRFDAFKIDIKPVLDRLGFIAEHIDED